MEDTWTLLVLSLAMLVGCYVAGMLPFAFQFAENKIKMVPVFGTGLLIGTSLAVIIPEGVHVMYINHHGHNHDELDKLVSKETVANQARNAVLESHGHESHNDQPANIHSIIGVALVAGFICMLLIDQCFGGGSHHFHSAADTEVVVNQPNSQNRHKITATLGLVVHAAADGIALGAAITMSEDRITMIVFLAIMLHKAPAAFGLVSFLMLEGFERSRIRKHLFVFSLSAPLLSIITFFGLSQQSKETLSNMHATGIALLFSAGTFLYVATVHVLPEVANTSGHTTHDGNTIVREHKGFTKKELLAIVVGAAIPVFLAMGHKH